MIKLPIKTHTFVLMIILIIVGTGISIFFSGYIKRLDSEQFIERFTHEVESGIRDFEYDIIVYQTIQKTLGDYFSGIDKHISHDEFNSISSAILNQHGVLSAIAYIPRITQHERSDFEQKAQYFSPKFKILDFDEQKHIREAVPDDFYFPPGTIAIGPMATYDGSVSLSSSLE